MGDYLQWAGGEIGGAAAYIVLGSLGAMLLWAMCGFVNRAFQSPTERTNERLSYEERKAHNQAAADQVQAYIAKRRAEQRGAGSSARWPDMERPRR